MSYLLNFKDWTRVNESMMILEQKAVTAIEVISHNDVKEAANIFAKTPKDGKALPYGKTIEYAGLELYCKTDPSMYKQDAYNSQLPMNIYGIVKSKSSVPTPMYLTSVFVDGRGKISKNQSEQRQLISDAMLWNPNDTTGVGFKGLDSAWDSFATPTFLQYCQNLKYWNYFKSPILSNKELWLKSKGTAGMAKCLQAIVDKCLNPPAAATTPTAAKPGVK